MIVKDEAGLLWVPGKCVCGPQVEIGEVILDVVVEGLADLGKVICTTMLSTVDVFVKSALEFIPVTAPAGAALTAARLVEGAKTFVENGVAATSFFGDWIGPTCGIPEFNFDITRVFDNIIGLSDGIGTSIGCLKKNKGECTKPKPVPPKSHHPTPQSPIRPRLTQLSRSRQNQSPRNPTKHQRLSPPVLPPPPVTSAAPVTTTEPPVGSSKTDSPSNSATTESSASACKIVRRAVNPDGKYLGKIGDPLVSTECVNGVTTIHSTITKQPIGSYPHTVAKTCSRKWEQACYHYRSVISVAKKATPPKTDMIRWTCSETAVTSKDGGATNAWGATAVRPRPRTAQHWFPWAKGFMPRDPKNGKGCERDEWPPRFFWPGDAVARQKGMEQRVRLIPAAQNGGAGSMFREFCIDNAAAVKKKQPTDPDLVDPKFIVTKEQNSRTDKAGPGGTPTVFTTVSVQTGHAVFDIQDWDNLPEEPDALPDDQKWHGLKENPCWPKALAPEDPGFVLLTNDEFYMTQHTALSDFTASYTEFPDVQVLINAMGGVQANLIPPFAVSTLQQAEYDKFFKNAPIPPEYLAVLPGMPGSNALPALPQAPPSRPDTDSDSDADGEFELERRGNGTLHRASDVLHGRGQEEGVHLWIRAYRGWIRAQQQSSHIIAPRTNAEPTPVGDPEGAPAVTPATARSYVGSGMPVVTRAVQR
ncbi:hypothetical protein B0T14DRAFT_500090 [Immersiella caudata]|uniref:Uncharacterized protein n=1 Tax=Immersiella caudata TaxID=314043 RepID=A0AA39U3D4_9PEZI|nr:hypothetical protein B0T14DRAFT_500090 [Immersiella caudata]